MAEKNERCRKKGSSEAAVIDPAGECRRLGKALQFFRFFSFLSAELLFQGLFYLCRGVLARAWREPRPTVLDRHKVGQLRTAVIQFLLRCD